MNIRKISIGLIALVLIVLAACVPAPTATPIPSTAAPATTKAPATVAPVSSSVASSSSASVSSVASSAASSAASITVTDSAGRTVTIPGSLQRIVTLTPSTTEIAFALGLGKQIVAVDTWSDYPAETKDLPKVKMMPVNFEQVVALKPDLVLVAGITSPDDIKKLADLKLTVLVVGKSDTSFDGMMADIQLVGKATGKDAQAKIVTDAMKQKLNSLKATLAKAQTKPRVYWEIDASDPAKPYTPGPGSFVNDLISIAGGTNIAANAKAAWAQINSEEIVAGNPEVIVLSDSLFGMTTEMVKARKGWEVISAVKNNKVFPIDDNLVSRPGPRLVDGLEAAAKLIHPELFK